MKYKIHYLESASQALVKNEVHTTDTYAYRLI